MCFVVLEGIRKERGVCVRESEAEEEANGSRRSGEGVRGTLLLNLRFEPQQSGESVSGGFHALLRGPEDPGLSQHRRQAHFPSLPPVPALHHHRRLPALRRQRRHARLRQRQPPACRRTARPQVQPGTLLLLLPLI